MANLRLLLLVFLCLILIPLNGSDTCITFIDVGQGDGICIRTGGEDILIDGGSSYTKKIGKYTLEPFLKSQRIGSIEKLFVTHADSDHINGLIYLAESTDISVDELYLPASAENDENYNGLITAFTGEYSLHGDEMTDSHGSGMTDSHGSGMTDSFDTESTDNNGRILQTCEAPGMRTRISYIKAGDIIELDKGSITCMSPDSSIIPSDMNAESLILLYREGNFSALFTGDAPKESELTMLSYIKSGSLPSVSNLTLLKAGHHGSRTSTSEELIETSSPMIAVLSYGENNRYGHPHPETSELLERYDVRMLRTAESGAVTVTTDGRNSVHISSFLSGD